MCNGFYVINTINDLPVHLDYNKSSFGRNKNELFLNKINNIEDQIREFFKLNRKPKITNKTDELFVKLNVCWL